MRFGPFSRKSSHGSVHSDASHAATELDESQAITGPEESPAATERDDDEGSDELGKLEAAMAKSKKAVAKTSASDREEKKAAAAEKKAAAAEKKKAAGKARRAAASIAKRPAAAPIAKRPAAACGKFDIEGWAADNLDENEAAEEPVRRHFVSRLHHRAFTAAKRAGLSDHHAADVRSRISARAKTLYDSVHKRG